MIDPESATQPPSDESLLSRTATAAANVAEASRLVELYGGRPLGGRILEVGCYDGAASYQLEKLGATVVGSDLARYYVVQRPGVPSEGAVAAQHGVLAALRARAQAHAGLPCTGVDFVEDDINTSALESGSFDAIVSFEVLEHVGKPAAAFAGMRRLLKPGGLAYHDYNPFFSVNGGHSLCTLDFPWGHARLDGADFDRYLTELRPAERDQAMRFYEESLNRMTLAQLRSAVSEAGLDLIAILPWLDRSLVADLSVDVLPDVQRTYPDATLDDLLATFVAVIVRRPL